MPTAISNEVFSTAEQKTIHDKFGRTAFVFRHSLSSAPIFEYDTIRRYCANADRDNVSVLFDVGKRNADSELSSSEPPLSLVDAVDNLQDVDALIFLKRISILPEWRSVLDGITKELEEILKLDFRRTFRRPVATIILASPGRVTPYHMDNSLNLLFQIRGKKEFYTFDGNDPEIVDHRCMEKYYGERDYYAAKLMPEIRNRATKHDLEPGKGIHVPLNFPHWAKAGSDVSIALSANWQPIYNRAGNVARVNNALRKLGINPKPYGRNDIVDGIKATALQSALTVVRSYRDRA